MIAISAGWWDFPCLPKPASAGRASMHRSPIVLLRLLERCARQARQRQQSVCGELMLPAGLRDATAPREEAEKRSETTVVVTRTFPWSAGAGRRSSGAIVRLTSSIEAVPQTGSLADGNASVRERLIKVPGLPTKKLRIIAAANADIRSRGCSGWLAGSDQEKSASGAEKSVEGQTNQGNSSQRQLISDQGLSSGGHTDVKARVEALIIHEFSGVCGRLRSVPVRSLCHGLATIVVSRTDGQRCLLAMSGRCRRSGVRPGGCGSRRCSFAIVVD